MGKKSKNKKVRFGAIAKIVGSERAQEIMREGKARRKLFMLGKGVAKVLLLLMLSVPALAQRYDTAYFILNAGLRPGIVLTMGDSSGGLIVDTCFSCYGGSGGSGTVTTFSAIVNNGLTQSVANPTTTPALTLGIGNGTLGDSLMATTYLKASNNLSDIISQSSARTNLGLGTSATHASTDYFLVANNLSEGVAATIKTNLSLDNVENTALSTWAGTTNITTLGTIATGVWSGTAIVYGKLALTGAILNADLAGSIALTKLADLSGTSLLIGSSASSAAVQEITLGSGLSMSGTTLNVSSLSNPMTSTGDIIYSSDNSGTPARLGIGSTNNFLQVISGLPSWQAVTIPVGANPSHSVSLTAANGSSVNFMRADGAPALDQSIAPIWTAAHTWGITNTATNTSAHVMNLRLNSSNTTTAGFGEDISFNGKAGTLVSQNFGELRVALDTASPMATRFEFAVSNSIGTGRAVLDISAGGGIPTLDIMGANGKLQIDTVNVLTKITLGTTVTSSSLTSFGSSPTFVTPILGTPTSGTLTNCTFPTLNQNTTGTANISGGTAGAIPYQSAANTTTVLAANSAAGHLLASGASAAPTWSNPTYPVAASPTSGNIIQSDGTNWTSTTNSGGWTIKSVAGSNFTRTAQTLADITGLTFSAAASTTYEIEATLMVTSSSVAGVQFAVNTTGGGGTPASSSYIIIAGAGSTSATAPISSSVSANGTAGAAMVTTSTAQTTVKIWATVNSGTGSPTISIQGLKTTSGTLTVLIGSTMKIRILGQ